jgi:hypothetical protein
VQGYFYDLVAWQTLGSLGGAFEQEHHLSEPLHAFALKGVHGHPPSIIRQSFFDERTTLRRNR